VFRSFACVLMLICDRLDSKESLEMKMGRSEDGFVWHWDHGVGDSKGG
jgi:hypothetical protein